MATNFVILATLLAGTISFAIGWKVRGRRANKEIALGAYVNCGFLMGCRKILNDSRLTELNDNLALQARTQLMVWESLDGIYPTPKFAIDHFVQQARQEFGGAPHFSMIGNIISGNDTAPRE